MSRSPGVFLMLLACGALALSPAKTAAVDNGPGYQLVEAFIRGDAGGIASSGHRVSTAGLSKMLRSKVAVETRAAIAAAPTPEDAWQLLEDLATVASGPDRSLSAPASRAGVTIAQSLDLARVMELEIAPAALQARAVAWRRIALSQGHWPDVRVHAIEVNTLLVRVLPSEARDAATISLGDLAADRDPELRRAALELQPQPLSSRVAKLAAKLLRNDGDPVVAIVAAQALCGGIAMGDAAAPTLETISEAGLGRLRDLIGNRNLPPVARIDAGYCLRAKGGKANKKALARLAKAIPKSVAKEARALLRGKR